MPRANAGDSRARIRQMSTYGHRDHPTETSSGRSVDPIVRRSESAWSLHGCAGMNLSFRESPSLRSLSLEEPVPPFNTCLLRMRYSGACNVASARPMHTKPAAITFAVQAHQLRSPSRGGISSLIERLAEGAEDGPTGVTTSVVGPSRSRIQVVPPAPIRATNLLRATAEQIQNCAPFGHFESLGDPGCRVRWLVQYLEPELASHACPFPEAVDKPGTPSMSRGDFAPRIFNNLQEVVETSLDAVPVSGCVQ
jgi:hypothetical protein